MTWTVYDTGPRKAKNVVLLIGDGLSPAHRIAARLLSKGIAEGKARGKLAMDDMPQMALVVDRRHRFHHHRFGEFRERLCHRPQVGGERDGRLCRPHRRSVRRSEGRDHRQPRPKRRNGMSVGIVSNTEIQDATPAAMIAHTRRRATYDEITEQYFALQARCADGRRACEFSAARARRAPSGATRPTSSRNSRMRGYALLRMRRSLKAVPQRYQAPARPVQPRQHGRRARPQIPEGAAASSASPISRT